MMTVKSAEGGKRRGGRTNWNLLIGVDERRRLHPVRMREVQQLYNTTWTGEQRRIEKGAETMRGI